MPHFQPVTKATPPIPFMRAVTVRTPKCPCESLRARHEVQITTNITFTIYAMQGKLLKATQLSLECKLTWKPRVATFLPVEVAFFSKTTVDTCLGTTRRSALHTVICVLPSQ